MAPKGFKEGDRVRFKPEQGKARNGVVTEIGPLAGHYTVELEGDPYATQIAGDQLSLAAGKVSIPDLRKRAKELNIVGYEELTTKELEAAVAQAQGEDTVAPKAKSKAKPTGRAKAKPKARGPAKKAGSGSPKAKPSKAPAKVSGGKSGANPYRDDTQRWFYAEALLNAGPNGITLKDVIKKVKPNVAINPAPQNDTPEYIERSIGGRTNVIARDLAQLGFGVEIEGRGSEAVFKVRPPTK